MSQSLPPQVRGLQQDKIDFSGLNQCMDDMKRGFFNLDRNKERLDKNLKQSHNTYFNKIIPEKRKKDETVIDEEFFKNKAYPRMVKIQVQQKMNENKRIEEIDYKDKINMMVQQKEVRERIAEKLKNKDQAILNKTEEQNDKGQIFSESNNKQLPQSSEGNIQSDTQRKLNIKDSLLKVMQLSNHDRSQAPNSMNRGSILDSKNSKQSGASLHNPISSLVIKFKQMVIKATGGPSSSKNVSQVQELRYTDPKKLAITKEEWIQMLMQTDLSFISYQQFKSLISDADVMICAARELQDIHGVGYSKTKSSFTRYDLEDILQHTDKDLFVSFRDKKISFDQLKARVAERQGIAIYKVLDDIKDSLHPSIMKDIDKFDETFKLLYKGKDKVKVKELLRPLEPHEVNHHCLRSIEHKHDKKAQLTKMLRDRNTRRSFDFDQNRNSQKLQTINEYDQDQGKIQSVMPSSRIVGLGQINSTLNSNRKIVSRNQPNVDSSTIPRGYSLNEQFVKYNKKHQEIIHSQMPFFSSQYEVQDDYEQNKGQLSQRQLNELQIGDSSRNQTIQYRSKPLHTLEELKTDLMFLKRLDEDGAPLNINSAHKRLLKINEDLDRAMKEDMLDEDQYIIGKDGQKIILTEEKRKELQMTKLKRDFAKAKNVHLLTNHSLATNSNKISQKLLVGSQSMMNKNMTQVASLPSKILNQTYDLTHSPETAFKERSTELQTPLTKYLNQIKGPNNSSQLPGYRPYTDQEQFNFKLSPQKTFNDSAQGKSKIQSKLEQIRQRNNQSLLQAATGGSYIKGSIHPTMNISAKKIFINSTPYEQVAVQDISLSTSFHQFVNSYGFAQKATRPKYQDNNLNIQQNQESHSYSRGENRVATRGNFSNTQNEKNLNFKDKREIINLPLSQIENKRRNSALNKIASQRTHENFDTYEDDIDYLQSSRRAIHPMKIGTITAKYEKRGKSVEMGKDQRTHAIIQRLSKLSNNDNHHIGSSKGKVSNLVSTESKMHQINKGGIRAISRDVIGVEIDQDIKAYDDAISEGANSSSLLKIASQNK